MMCSTSVPHLTLAGYGAWRITSLDAVIGVSRFTISLLYENVGENLIRSCLVLIRC